MLATPGLSPGMQMSDARIPWAIAALALLALGVSEYRASGVRDDQQATNRRLHAIEQQLSASDVGGLAEGRDGPVAVSVGEELRRVHQGSGGKEHLGAMLPVAGPELVASEPDAVDPRWVSAEEFEALAGSRFWWPLVAAAMAEGD